MVYDTDNLLEGTNLAIMGILYVAGVGREMAIPRKEVTFLNKKIPDIVPRAFVVGGAAFIEPVYATFIGAYYLGRYSARHS